jgi:ubiquinone/menaquinone biosynthesis C-methylase UbiE
MTGLQETENGFAAERATLKPGTPMWGEHRARYHFAVPLLAERRVLDVACGTGFGVRILLDGGTRHVIAADYSEEALKITSALATSATSVVRLDGTNLPFPDASIDAISSFETVEHIPDWEAFVSELRRVLKPDGVMVMSTPNALYTKPVNGVPVNPFHVYEFTPEEFRNLLERHFSSVQLYGQRVRADYRICPYWETPDMLPTNMPSRIKVALWKLQVRLPGNAREWISQIVSGRSFFPGEHDFVFSEDELESGYVQVAVARP